MYIRNSLFSYLFISIWLVLALFVPLNGNAQEDFLDPDEAFVFSAAMATPQRLDVHFQVAPKYYMYRDRFDFTLEPQEHESRLGEIVRPQGLVQYDPTFEEDLEVYYGQYTIQVNFEPGADKPLILRILSQGCADAGLCYSPSEHVIQLTPDEDGYIASGDGVLDQVPDIESSTPLSEYDMFKASSNTSEQSLFMGGSEQSVYGSGGSLLPSNQDDTGFAAYLAQASIWQIILFSALFGVLLSFTPCVLPMVPILLAILAGGSQQKKQLTRWQGLKLAAIFVLGMSIVYTVLGVAAGIIGASLAAWLQKPWVLAVFAALLALFALAMFDVFTMQAPTSMQNRLNSFVNKLPGGKASAVFIMGMVSALIVGPCVAAPLAGVLLFISQTGDLVLGGTSLFSMAWGEGLLLLAVGASSGMLMPKAGAWMQGVKTFFGLLLLATALWMIQPLLPIWIAMLAWAFMAIFSAYLLGAFSGLSHTSEKNIVLTAFGKSIGYLLAIWALLLMVGVATGGRDIIRPLSHVIQTYGASLPIEQKKIEFIQIDNGDQLDELLASPDRPIMLDFYADWCVSCIQMEKFTFSDPEVAARMNQMLLVQADVTDNTAEHRKLLKRFNLFGPPGIIFFDSNGNHLESPRVVGFQNAGQFAANLDKVLLN